MPGLTRNHYFRSADDDVVGAIYIWRSRAEAEAVYAGEWLQRVQRHYGVEPEITWFESPVIVDNVSRQIIKA